MDQFGLLLVTDPIEQNLMTIAARLQTAWREAQCLTCPLGELAALAAATLVFYKEQKTASAHDHWTHYRQQGEHP